MKSRLLGAVCACLIVTSFNSFAASLFGSDIAGSELYSIDATNGSHTTIGTISQPSPGLAYDGVAGVMYSSSSTGLYTIDTNDASSVLVGNFGGLNLNLTGLTHSGDYSKLYASESTGSDSGLYSIDKLTGAASFVGNYGTGIDGLFDIIDLATNSSGQLYGAGLDGLIYTINDATGAATLLGSVSGLGGPANGSGVTAISFDENDVLYGIHTTPDSLITIDINALTFSTVGGDIGSDVRGMAFAIDASVVPVPAAIWLFGSGLIGLIGIAKRKAAYLENYASI